MLHDSALWLLMPLPQTSSHHRVTTHNELGASCIPHVCRLCRHNMVNYIPHTAIPTWPRLTAPSTWLSYDLPCTVRQHCQLFPKHLASAPTSSMARVLSVNRVLGLAVDLHHIQ
jgi:hypothetical protein